MTCPLEDHRWPSCFFAVASCAKCEREFFTPTTLARDAVAAEVAQEHSEEVSSSSITIRTLSPLIVSRADQEPTPPHTN
jgi:hypothetical protein